MFENARRGRQARTFTTNVPKILHLKSFSEQIFFGKLTLGAPARRTEYGHYSVQQISTFEHLKPHYSMNNKSLNRVSLA